MKLEFAVILIIAALFQSGCSVAGGPAAEKRVEKAAQTNESPLPAPTEAAQSIKILVNAEGFTPASVSLKKGSNSKLIFFREDANNCGDEVVFQTLNIRKPLPVGREVEVEISPLETGEIAFSCGMNMMKGKIIVE